MYDVKKKKTAALTDWLKRPLNGRANGHIKRAIKKRVLDSCMALVEKSLGVRVYREAPFGTDPYPAISALRSWSSKDVVFDVGANDGRALFRIQRHLSNPTIFAFEPVSTTYETLVERTKHLDNVRCLQLALGAESGQKPIYLHELAVMNSFSREWAPPTGTETVEIATVDEVMAEEDIEFVHFLKIDTEGHELEVLKGARDALTASRVAIIQVEVGVNQRVSPHTSLEEVASYLAPMGYFLHGIFHQARATRQVRPPAKWKDDRAAGYKPSVLKYCDAVFIGANLEERDYRA